MRNQFIFFSVVMLVIVGVIAPFWWPILWSLALFGPLIVLGVIDMTQDKHSIKRNYPLLGRGRWFMEFLRPKIYQYFVESDIDGRPFSRIDRSVIYQRSKLELDTAPFGTQLDVYAEGYEWVNHSIAALAHHDVPEDPRILVGGPACKQPYSSSILNISAMSYGSLSPNAVMALNAGAKIGGFAHNTGEGGISQYHLENNGDIVFQVGTGYFGARELGVDGFSAKAFAVNALRPQVKMIELKLSQGAKPGHGGILPAAKNTPEIAAIRGVQPGTTVNSPPYHTAFHTPIEMMQFIQQLRDLSGGKPIGFKLCVGQRSEFLAICMAMVETGIMPDFITVDGGEGGTGAAPVEFSNSVGWPLRDGLAFVYDALVGFGLKQHIKLFASGKVATAFDMFRLLAIGADACNAARAFMMSLGCIQSLECHKNICPVGVTSQKPELMRGLVVGDKKQRVANFHNETLRSFREFLAATGIHTPTEITRHHLNRNESQTIIRRYDESYPYIPVGSLLQAPYPDGWTTMMQEASAKTFARQHATA